MKPLSQQDYYETLEIPPNASAKEVDRAYQLARSTYSEGSLAGHSVFDRGDVELIRERIEMAFRTLSDPDLRQSYDHELKLHEEKSEEVNDSDPAALATSVATPSEPMDGPMPFDIEDLDEESGDFDGPRLRRARMRHGVELEEIARVTKVNESYLEFIEEERFADLPAAVYIRGFVMGYAECIGLDPKRVAKSYMERLDAKGGAPKRGLFGRR